jgi:hypothetical protein
MNLARQGRSQKKYWTQINLARRSRNQKKVPQVP